jgi:fermentation-respiration switch protein FrsA (DUF1100 family)
MGGHIIYQMPKYINSIDFLIPILGAPDLKRHYNDNKLSLLGNVLLKSLDDWWDRLSVSTLAYSPTTKILIIEGELDTIVDYRNANSFYQKLISFGHKFIQFSLYPVGHEMTPRMESEIAEFIVP